MRWNTLNKVNNPLVLRSGNIGTNIPTNRVSTSTNRIPNTIPNRVTTINSNTNSNRITCWRRWNSNNSNNANHRSAPKTGTPKTSNNANPNNPKTSTTAPDKASTSFLTSFLAPKQMPPRYAPRWYAEMALLCTVFGITGTSTMVLVRPAVSDGLGLRGTMKEGKYTNERMEILTYDAYLFSLKRETNEGTFSRNTLARKRCNKRGRDECDDRMSRYSATEESATSTP